MRAALILGIVFCGAACAATATLTADTYVVPSNSANYGALPAVLVGGSSHAIGLLQFDLSSLPTGTTAANVQWAQLRIFVNSVPSSGSFSLYTAGTAWTETGAAGNSPTTGTLLTSGISINFAETWVSVDVTAQVEAWLNGTANNGVALAAQTNGAAIYFDSKENTQTSHAARLEISLLGSSGPAGTTGAAGPTGPGGATGPSGAQGAAGPSGLAGATGAQGITGSSGPAGSIGPTGIAGATGPSGATGTTGAAGATGAEGPAGATGATGTTGAAGTVGATGTTGAAGAQGAAGSIGSTGATGTTGGTGPAGPAGASGSAGPTGPTGPAGVTGSAGVAGTAGVTGPAGTTGSGFSNIASVATLANVSTIADSDTHLIFLISNATGAAAITLPHASAVSGRVIVLRATSSNLITISAQGADGIFTQCASIPGLLTSITFTAGMELVSNGTTWSILSASPTSPNAC